MLRTGEYQQLAAELGDHLHAELASLAASGGGVRAVRGRGLWAGVDLDPAVGSGHRVAELLMERGVLVKETHGSTIRIAPPLVIGKDELTWAVEQLRAVLSPG
jgi:ornithine--oxo-acid transaminase